MKTYKEFKILAEPFNSDIISGVLWNLQPLGILEEDDFLIVYGDTSNKFASKDIEAVLLKLKKEKLLKDFKIFETEIEERNWNEEWERTINIVKISDNLVIKPSFKEYQANENQIVLTIDPKMSFGTGEHGATQLCALLIEKLLKPGDFILDVGSGTAILAIEAVKLGASKAIAIDNDEWCFENGVENCKMNGVEDKAEVRLGEISIVNETGFDLIAANINKPVLIEIAEEISKRIKQNGKLILSGFLIEDEEDIKRVYGKAGFVFIEKMTKDEWLGIAFRKTTAA